MLLSNISNENYKKILITLLFILLCITQAATDIFVPALPQMAHEFGVSSHDMSMTITYYVYAQATLFLVIGPISDLLGRKNTILFTLLITIISTFCISESKDLNAILFFRVFQALGSAGIFIVSKLVLKEVYAKEELLRVTGVVILGMILSPALAPVIGALILKYSSWRWIFRLLGIFLVVFWGIAILLLRESNHCTSEYRANFSITKLIKGYIVLLKSWLFIRYVFIVGGSFASFYAFITMSSYMYIQEFHVSEISYSYLFTFIAFAYFLGNKIMSYMINKKIATYDIVKVGIVIGVIVCVLSVVNWCIHSIVLFIILITFCGWLTRLSTAFINPPIQVEVLYAFPEQSSSAVGLISSLQYVFGAIGSWSVGALDMLPSQSIIITTIAYTLISIAFFTLVKKKDFA